MALRQVSILGLGLIGSSLGLALRRGPNAPKVVGFDVNPESLHRAARGGAIDRSCGTLAEACRGADAVILAAPVRAILQLLPEVAPHLGPETLLTDTGGTKRQIIRVAETALPEPSPFVGGHPLAGPLTAGVVEPSGEMFAGTMYCLTPTRTTPEWAVQTAIDLVESVGAQPHFVDADEHDGLLAGISHLPYFTAVALINSVARQSSWGEMSAMAAGGFRSATAPGESDPEVWADVAATNRENVLRQLDSLIAYLTELRDMVDAGDEGLRGELARAQEARKAWLARRG
jgi:prephenate dehydrogenase